MFVQNFLITAYIGEIHLCEYYPSPQFVCACTVNITKYAFGESLINEQSKALLKCEWMGGVRIFLFIFCCKQLADKKI